MAEGYEHRLPAEELSEEENSEADSLSSFFERFTFRGQDSDVALKIKRRTHDVKFSAKCTLESPRLQGLSRPDWIFSARPVDPCKNWKTRALNKIAVNPLDRTLTWSMAKLRYKWFQWKVGVQYDFQARRLLWRYRVTSKWNTDGTKAYRKERVALAEKVLLQPHYSFDFQLPAVEGGNNAAAEVEQPEFHFEVSRIDVVLDTDGTGLTPFWRKQKQGPHTLPMLTEGPSAVPQPTEVRLASASGSFRRTDIASPSRQEASELWMTHGPESPVTEVATPADRPVTKDRKSHRPIPWCLDNPLLFPWLKPQARKE